MPHFGWGGSGGSAATPQSDRQGEAIIPRTKESIDDALSILEMPYLTISGLFVEI